MARTPGLLGVVAQDRPFLMAIERLDRRIDVQDPGLGEQWLDAKCKMLAQPCRAFLLVDRLESAPYRILADDLFHAEQLGQDGVAAQRRDMGVTLVASEHGEHRRAENVALLRGVGTAVAQRTVDDEGVEQPGRFEEMDEERELAERRHRRLMVPFDTDRPKEAVDVDASGRLARDNQGLFTGWVSR